MSTPITGTFSAAGNSAEIHSTARGLFVSARGTFGTGTVSVQHKITDGSFVDLDAGIIGTFTADGDKFVSGFMPGITLRLKLTGGITPSIAYILQA